MKNKITLPELVNQISNLTGTPKNKVEEFLKELITIVSRTLSDGESVRIKGIGTFKVNDVESRRSVHVATGENIEIPGHRKVSFSPSGELADAVNEPFSSFEAVELSDDVTEEMLAEADDYAEAEADLDFPFEEVEEVDSDVETPLFESQETEENKASAEKETESNRGEVVLDVPFEFAMDETAEEKPAVATKEAEPQSSEVSASESDIKTSESPAEKSIDSKEDTEKEEEPKQLEKVDDPYYEAVEEQFSEPKKGNNQQNQRSSFKIGLLVGVLSAACFIFIALAVWRAVGPESYSRLVGIGITSAANQENEEFSEDEFGYVDSSTEESETTEEPEQIEANTEISDAERLAEIEAERKAAEEKQKEEARLAAEKKAKEEAEKRAKEKESKESQAKDNAEKSNSPVYDTITKTRYLTTMAKDHYGNYHLWPYIYEENKAILGHPDRIRPGTKIVIPPLSKYGVNPKNPSDIAAAKKKGAAIYDRYK